MGEPSAIAFSHRGEPWQRRLGMVKQILPDDADGSEMLDRQIAAAEMQEMGDGKPIRFVDRVVTRFNRFQR